MWIEKTAEITSKGAHFPIPVDEIQMIEDGVYSSDSEGSGDGLRPVPNTIQLEAIPPYPTRDPEDIVPYWETPRVERPSIFHEEFEGTTFVDSSLSPTLSPTLNLGETQELGIGSLIAGKIKEVVKDGSGVCQCLRRKMRNT